MDKRKAPCFECCGTRFANAKILKSHMATYHQNGLKCFKCDHIFGTPSKLRKHQIIHFGKKEFVCKICNFATMHKHNAKRHLKSHEREGNYPSIGRELVRQSHSERKKIAKSFIHRSHNSGSMTSGLGKIESSDGSHFAGKKQRKQYNENNETAKTRRVSRTVHNHGKRKSGNRTKEDKFLISIDGSEVQKKGNDSAPVSIGLDKQLLHSSRPLGQKGSKLLTVGHIPHVNDGYPLSGLADPSDLSTNSIQNEARQIRSQMSVLTAIPTLLPLLKRLLELSASMANRIPETMEEGVRFEAVECLEYLLNTMRMSIVRWKDLIGRSDRDTALSAVLYAYGTLPVFVNWEKHEHLQMLENTILLILNTVKNRQSPPAIRSQMKSQVEPRVAMESMVEV